MIRRRLASVIWGLVLRLEGLAERLDPAGYPKTIDVEQQELGDTESELPEMGHETSAI